MSLARGTVILVDLNPTRGHEQQGLRPCVVVSDPEVVADQRFPLLGIVPLTRTVGTGALYPSLEPGSSGLTATSYALTDNVRSVDKRRVHRTYGQVTGEEMERIDEGLVLFLCLSSGGGDDADNPAPQSES